MAFAERITRFSFSSILPLTKMAMAAGTKVIEKISAPINAAITVNAIGWNILPSTPSRANKGKYTNMMISMPNAAGLKTSLVL